MTAGALVIGSWLGFVLVWALISDRCHQKRMRDERAKHYKRMGR